MAAGYHVAERNHRKLVELDDWPRDAGLDRRMVAPACCATLGLWDPSQAADFCRADAAAVLADDSGALCLN